MANIYITFAVCDVYVCVYVRMQVALKCKSGEVIPGVQEVLESILKEP